MPRPALRSRSLKRKKITTPGGRKVTHYERRRPSAARCRCGALLSGIPRLRPAEMGKRAKTEKRPTRPFGGNLCPQCTREQVKERVFNLNK